MNTGTSPAGPAQNPVEDAGRLLARRYAVSEHKGASILLDAVLVTDRPLAELARAVLARLPNWPPLYGPFE